jgi:CBS domain-containing protein
VSFQLSLSTDKATAAYPNPPLFIEPEASVGDVLQLLRAQRTGSVLICSADSQNGGTLVGIFTERDALKWMAAGESMDRPISEAMSRDPVSLPVDASVGDAIRKMSEGGYRRLPILSAEGTPIGISSVNGIIHYLVDHFPETIYTLPPQPGVFPGDREGA